MVTGSLAGCGSSNGSGKTETAPATEGTTETADAGASASGADTLVASSAHFEGKFSPFFAASAVRSGIIVDMTQIPLLGSDRQALLLRKVSKVRLVLTMEQTIPIIPHLIWR